MNEIKFRGWNKQSKIMVDSIKLFTPEDTYNLNEAFNDDMIVLPLQYTGLKDKNGKEIYERDIVKYNFGGKDFINEVKWDRFAWFVDNNFIEATGKLYEVIGNIYENKDLIN